LFFTVSGINLKLVMLVLLLYCSFEYFSQLTPIAIRSLTLLLQAQPLLLQPQPLFFQPPALHLHLLLLMIGRLVASSLGTGCAGDSPHNGPGSGPASAADEPTDDGTAHGASQQSCLDWGRRNHFRYPYKGY
jgi:hypothetical protein